jgi:hypothetical protein
MVSQSVQAQENNLKKMIKKIYEEQNSEKIKLANEIINRSVFQRARATYDSSTNRNV